MNDEIKEILDFYERMFKQNEMIMCLSKMKILLDYITNLQEENKRLKENKLTPDELVNLLNQELVRQNKDYKEKFDKTIEYLGIDEKILETCEVYVVNGIEVYKILQGSDKE